MAVACMHELPWAHSASPSLPCPEPPQVGAPCISGTGAWNASDSAPRSYIHP